MLLLLRKSVKVKRNGDKAERYHFQHGSGSGNRNRTHHKLKDSPVPVEVISQRDLQNANPSSFQDALVKLVPSISVQTTAMGTTLYVNGLPDKYLLVLINGKK